MKGQASRNRDRYIDITEGGKEKVGGASVNSYCKPLTAFRIAHLCERDGFLCVFLF